MQSTLPTSSFIFMGFVFMGNNAHCSGLTWEGGKVTAKVGQEWLWQLTLFPYGRLCPPTVDIKDSALG